MTDWIRVWTEQRSEAFPPQIIEDVIYHPGFLDQYQNLFGINLEDYRVKNPVPGIPDLDPVIYIDSGRKDPVGHYEYIDDTRIFWSRHQPCHFDVQVPEEFHWTKIVCPKPSESPPFQEGLVELTKTHYKTYIDLYLRKLRSCEFILLSFLIDKRKNIIQTWPDNHQTTLQNEYTPQTLPKFVCPLFDYLWEKELIPLIT